ncbi:MAG TPA: hypothetical protein VIF81_13605 [Pyrinomonadaceae bacterium]|jgi:hypothetical protein
MSIQNELSSDIAVALLTGKDRDPEKLNHLKEVVLQIHSILQKTTAKSGSSKRARSQAAGENQSNIDRVKSF